MQNNKFKWVIKSKYLHFKKLNLKAQTQTITFDHLVIGVAFWCKREGISKLFTHDFLEKYSLGRQKVVFEQKKARGWSHKMSDVVIETWN